MRRITFNPMIDGISGGLRTKQTGKLTFNGGKLYQSANNFPVAAENFLPIIIGMQGRVGTRAGKQWFAVKTRQTYTPSAVSKLAMACIGGGSAVLKAVKASETLFMALAVSFQDVKSKYNSFEDYLWKGIYPALENKTATISWEGATAKANNPWVEGGTGTSITIDSAIKAKFNSVLKAEE